MVANYNAEELADDCQDKKGLEKAEQSAERKAAKQKKKHVQSAAVYRGTCFVSNPTTGTASSGMQIGYRVPRQPGMIVVILIVVVLIYACSSHFCSLCC